MSLILGSKVKPPAGFRRALVKHPVLAMQDWYNAASVSNQLYPPTNGRLGVIFSSVNSQFTYRRESFDSWAIGYRSGPFYGDCEDFAIACRHITMAIGYKGGRLLLCKERKLNAGGHCVFIIKDYVFDCRLSNICHIVDFTAIYNLIAVSSPALLGSWYSVEGVTYE